MLLNTKFEHEYKKEKNVLHKYLFEGDNTCFGSDTRKPV